MPTEKRSNNGRDKKGRFTKGNTGGGRPKTPKEFKELAQENSIPALKKVIEILNNPKSKDRDKLKAAEMVMDRAWGKPLQGMELSGPDGNQITIKLEGELSEWAK